MSTPAKTSPAWAFVSLVTNFILLLAVIVLILREHGLTAFFATVFSNFKPNDQPEAITRPNSRLQLNYQEWLDILKKEAKAAAQKHPQNLTILLGDSLSLWFPAKLLPTQRNWLNQGISGETSTGLLKRLKLFDVTKPQTIFVMIGINDLIKGTSDEIILENQRQIILHLQRAHPKTQIVIQSILPHGGEKFLTIPNSRIRKLNRQLQDTAANEGVKYLDLYPLFANQHGELRPELTTDGLHLTREGYLVWGSALQLYSNLELKS